MRQSAESVAPHDVIVAVLNRSFTGCESEADAIATIVLDGLRKAGWRVAHEDWLKTKW